MKSIRQARKLILATYALGALIVLSLLVAGALGKKAPSAKPEAEPVASGDVTQRELQAAPAEQS